MKPARYDHILNEIHININKAHEDREARIQLLKELEKHFCEYCTEKGECKNHNAKSLLYYAPQAPIEEGDILPFHSMLNSIGTVECIVLIISSPGGSGPIAEKVVDLCRKHLKKKFIVVVPTFAKSAATLIALSSDMIVMGETSELGPIDAQVPVLEAGLVQWVSAQDYLDVREELVKQIDKAAKAGEPTDAYLAQLTTLNPAFLQYCHNNMEFSKDFARKRLTNFMFKGYTEPDKEALIDRIVKTLSSRSRFFTHGRMITIEEIMQDGDLKNLKTKKLPAEYECWNSIEGLTMRADIFMGLDNKPGQVKKKLFQASDFTMLCFGAK